MLKNLGAHEVFTVSYKGRAGLKNGELLQAAENDGIEVFLTGDQTLTYEQNLTGRTIAIVALSSVEWDILKHHLPLIVAGSSPQLTVRLPADSARLPGPLFNWSEAPFPVVSGVP